MKHGQPKDQSNSLSKIAKLSGIKRSALQKIYNKGIGAYKTNPSSVRPNVKSKEQWAMARVYSAVTRGTPASRVDAKELREGRGQKPKKEEQAKQTYKKKETKKK